MVRNIQIISTIIIWPTAWKHKPEIVLGIKQNKPSTKYFGMWWRKDVRKKQRIHETKTLGGLGYVERMEDGVLKVHLNIYEMILRWNKINAMHVQLLRANIFYKGG